MPDEIKTEEESQRHADVVAGIIHDLEAAQSRARELEADIALNREFYRKLDDLREAGGRAGRRKQLDDELTKMQNDLQHQRDLIDNFVSVLEDARPIQDVASREESLHMAGVRGLTTEGSPRIITQPPSPTYRIPESRSDESREGGQGGGGDQPGGPSEGGRSDQLSPESAFRTREGIQLLIRALSNQPPEYIIPRALGEEP